MTVTVDPPTPPPAGSSAPPPKPPRPPRPVRRAEPSAAAGAVSLALGLVAALAVWLLLFTVLFSGLVEHHAQSDLYAQFRQQVAAQLAPVGAPIGRGEPVATLTGPHLSRVVVVEGSSAKELRSGPGLYPSSPLPGQPGTSVVLGRSTAFSGPFGAIDRLRAGDRLTTTTGEGTYTFRVVGQSLSGGTIPAAFVAADARLELVSSASRGFLGIPTPGRTRFVYAVLVGTAAVGGGTEPAAAIDRPNAADRSELYPLVLWLQLLLLVALAVTWVYLRAPARYRAHTWVIGLPVGLAGLFGASTALFGLLPNLI